MHRLLVIAVVVLAGVRSAHARVEVPVTSCGQVIHRGQAGRLATDLDCGHQWGTCYTCAIWGPDTCTQIEPVVPCGGPSDCPDPSLNKCDGGEAERSVGVYLEPGARLYLNGHSISGVEIGISGNRPDGTGGPQRIRILGPGMLSKTRVAADFYNGSLGGGITLTDSLFGIAGSKVRLDDVNTSGNVIGVSVFQTLRATRLTSDNNRYAGLIAYRRGRLDSSHIAGSAVVDIAAELKPQVTATTCAHSAMLEDTTQPGIYGLGLPWGVCSSD